MSSDILPPLTQKIIHITIAIIAGAMFLCGGATVYIIMRLFG